jgi:predicted metal-dependent hydrolase
MLNLNSYLDSCNELLGGNQGASFSEALNWRGLPLVIERRPRLQRLSLRIKPFVPIQVTAGLRVSLQDIHRFLDHHALWIERRTKIWQGLVPPRAAFGIEGDSYMYLGRFLSLKYSVTPSSKAFVALGPERLLYLRPLDVSAASVDPSRVQSAVMGVFDDEAEKVLRERTHFWSSEMGLQPVALKFRRQRTRWGSCPGKGGISFNKRLIGAPMKVIDSVVVHELAHLRFMNHSRDFWSLVRTHVPGLDECDDWLRKHTFAL